MRKTRATWFHCQQQRAPTLRRASASGSRGGRLSAPHKCRQEHPSPEAAICRSCHPVGVGGSSGCCCGPSSHPQ